MSQSKASGGAESTFGINARLKDMKWRLDIADCKVDSESQQEQNSSAILQFVIEKVSCYLDVYITRGKSVHSYHFIFVPFT